MLKLQDINGFGKGSLGIITIDEPTQINSYAHVLSVSEDKTEITITNINSGAYGTFTNGSEVMFHISGCLTEDSQHMGRFYYAYVKSVKNNVVKLDRPIKLDIGYDKYACQLISVPNFETLLLKTTLQPLKWDDTNMIGGIIALKINNLLNMENGSITAIGAGFSYEHNFHPLGIMSTNETFKDRYIINEASGIVIVQAEEITLSEKSRLGAPWDGTGNSPKGGIGTSQAHNGADSQPGLGGASGSNYKGEINFGSLPAGYWEEPKGTMGWLQDRARTGANVVLIADKINGWDEIVFSTGGEGAEAASTNQENASAPGNAGYGAPGGGGNSEAAGCGGGSSGFGYIATNAKDVKENAIAYYLDTLDTTFDFVKDTRTKQEKPSGQIEVKSAITTNMDIGGGITMSPYLKGGYSLGEFIGALLAKAHKHSSDLVVKNEYNIEVKEPPVPTPQPKSVSPKNQNTPTNQPIINNNQQTNSSTSSSSNNTSASQKPSTKPDTPTIKNDFSHNKMYDVPGNYEFTIPAGISQLKVTLVGGGSMGLIRFPDASEGGFTPGGTSSITINTKTYQATGGNQRAGGTPNGRVGDLKNPGAGWSVNGASYGTGGHGTGRGGAWCGGSGGYYQFTTNVAANATYKLTVGRGGGNSSNTNTPSVYGYNGCVFIEW